MPEPFSCIEQYTNTKMFLFHSGAKWKQSAKREKKILFSKLTKKEKRNNRKKQNLSFLFSHEYRRKKTDMLLVEWRINRLWLVAFAPYQQPPSISHMNTNNRENTRKESIFCDFAAVYLIFRFKSASAQEK